MARSLKPTRNNYMPGLFDALDDFNENTESDFHIIPDKDMAKIAMETKLKGQCRQTIDELPPMSPADHIFFMSFGSGSSGNCSYIGDRNCGFLIDAGVEVAKVTEGLRSNGISIENVKGICLTHDHGDHIRDVYALLRRNRHMRVYCTPKTLNGILRRHNVSRRIKDYHSPVYKEFQFKIGNFEITPFEVMHDGADNTGFYISNGERKFAIATDLGCISDRVAHYMRMADYIVIESNYDLQMLREGRYPEYLKARIEASNGHLDNKVTASFISEIYTSSLRNVFLCHLSQDNNTPAKAINEVKNALSLIGVTRIGNGIVDLTETPESERPQLHLVALPRHETSPLYTLGI